MIKSICDFADGNKGEDKHQKQNSAATLAFNFCKNVLEEVVVAAKGHAMTEVEEVKATCTTSGYQEYKCSVCDKEYLSVTAHFEIDCLGNDFFIECMYFCLNRITIGWRCLDNRQVSRSHE